jgi:hypothetical protein
MAGRPRVALDALHNWCGAPCSSRRKWWARGPTCCSRRRSIRGGPTRGARLPKQEPTERVTEPIRPSGVTPATQSCELQVRLGACER